MPPQANDPDAPSHGSRLREVAGYFIRLGFTAFGGPAAHVAMMEDELVYRRRWVDRQRFLDLVSALNFIPGPNSTELAIHLGLIRAGYPGLVVAGICFITPAMLIILPIVWAYVRFGALPQAPPVFAGIGAAVVAIIAVALWRFFRASVRGPFTAAAAVLAAGGVLGLRWLDIEQPELIILACAAAVGVMRVMLQRARGRMLSIAPILLLADAPPPSFWQNLGLMTLFFLKVGATLFGSGYVLISFLHSGLVAQYGWLTETQLRDAISVGQFTPGPLLTTATFCGYLAAQHFGGGMAAAIAGGVLATIAIFLPSFILVAMCAPVLDRLRAHPMARSALDALNAAVVALLAVVLVDLARPTLAPGGQMDWLQIVLAAAALATLLLTRLNATWLVLACGAAGAVLAFLR
jgi:chromate transporter